MSMKIHVSYTEESEVKQILELLKPLKCRFKVKESNGKSQYKHLYFIPKNAGKACDTRL